MSNSENLTDLRLASEQVQALEQATLKQSETTLWHEQRVGRVTASKAHQVLHTSISNPARSLIKEICSRSLNQLKVPAVMWGKEHERDALATYKKVVAHLDVERNSIFPHSNIVISDQIKKCHCWKCWTEFIT
eukprot:gene13389-14762_t